MKYKNPILDALPAMNPNIIKTERLVFSTVMFAYSAGMVYVYNRIRAHSSEEHKTSFKLVDVSMYF